jgi:hypothetical protein
LVLAFFWIPVGYLYPSSNRIETSASRQEKVRVPSVKPALKLVAACLVYSLIIALSTLVVILVLTRELERVLLFLSYALLVEGGLALTTGGVVASFSSTIGRLGESVLHAEPWDAKRQKEAEGQARSWIVTGILLFLVGLFA